MHVRSARCFEWYLHIAKFPATKRQSFLQAILETEHVPIMNQRLGTPSQRHAPFCSPSSFKFQIGETLPASSSPTRRLIDIVAPSKLLRGASVSIHGALHARMRGKSGTLNVPGGVHDDVGLEFAAVVEFEARLGEALDLAVVLDLDLAVDDQLARADVCVAC